MKGQDVIHCPRCGSNKINAENRSGMLLKLAIISTISIVLIPIAIILWISWFVNKYITKYQILGICVDCKHRWSVSRDKYKEYQTIIKNNEKLQA